MRRIDVMLLAMLVPACGHGNRLGDYSYSGRSLAVVYDFPPDPAVLTGPYFVGQSRDPVHAILRAGSRVATEIQAYRVRERLDSATALVDVADRVAQRTSERATRYLRTRLTEQDDEADFVLEVQIHDYGIDAKEWDAAAHFFVDAEVTLLAGLDGRLIWKTRVRDSDPITPAIFGGRSVVRNVVTAAALADLSVEEIARALEQLADYTADHVTGRLRDALDASRR
jgi:hypothetical protein